MLADTDVGVLYMSVPSLVYACHTRRRIHACHMRRRIHACYEEKAPTLASMQTRVIIEMHVTVDMKAVPGHTNSHTHP